MDLVAVFHIRMSGHDSGNDSQEEEEEMDEPQQEQVVEEVPASKRPRKELSQQETVLLQPTAAPAKEKIQVKERHGPGSTYLSVDHQEAL